MVRLSRHWSILILFIYGTTVEIRIQPANHLLFLLRQPPTANRRREDGPAPQPQSSKINPLKSRFCIGPSGQRLERPLGLQSYELDDLALSASSFSNEQVRPHLAR